MLPARDLNPTSTGAGGPLPGVEAPPWMADALCVEIGDPDMFFPKKGASSREAKQVCLGCDVRGECLEWALANNEQFGVWGGLSERERRRLRRGRPDPPRRPANGPRSTTPGRPPDPAVAARRDLVAALHDEGLTTLQIADRLDASYMAIYGDLAALRHAGRIA